MITPAAWLRYLVALAAVLLAVTLVTLALPETYLPPKPLGDAAITRQPALKIRLTNPVPTAQATAAAETAVRPQPAPAPAPEPRPEARIKPKPESTRSPTPIRKPEPASDIPEPKPVPDSELPVIPAPTTTVGSHSADPTGQLPPRELTAGSSAGVDSYLSRLLQHLGRHYEYPRRARRLGQQGAPVILFEFNRHGALLKHSLRESSGHALLDRAALEMLAQAAPLPPVPEGMAGQTFRFALPVQFRLR